MVEVNSYIRTSKKKDLKVLDLGCGPGFLSILLSKQGCQVTGIDYSNQMLEEAKHNAKENNVHTDFKKKWMFKN